MQPPPPPPPNAGHVPQKGGGMLNWRMRTQLCMSFGLSQIAVFIVFIIIWLAAVITLKNDFVTKSNDILVEQIRDIGSRLGSEIKDVFLAKMDVGKAGLLWPVIFSIFDFQYRDVSDLRLTNLNAKTTYLGNKVFGCSSEYMCLKQPLNKADRVLCNKPPTQMDCTGIPANGAPFAMSPGGCTCDRRKAVSNGSTSFFATGMDGSESSAMTTGRGWLEAQQRVQVSSLMHNFVRSAWALNPSWVQVYFGIPEELGTPVFRSGSSGAEKIAKASAIRSYPGQVREGLADGSLTKPNGRFYVAAERGWYNDASDKLNSDVASRRSILDISFLTSEMRSQRAIFKQSIGKRKNMRYAQLQARRPSVITTAPYQDADGKGFMITLAAPVNVSPESAAGSLEGVVAADLLINVLEEVVLNMKMREKGEAILFHKASKLVLATKQWTNDGSQPPSIDSLLLSQTMAGSPDNQKKFSDIVEEGRSMTSKLCEDGSGSLGTPDVLVHWTEIGGDTGLCLVFSTPISEILDPIASQIAAIDTQAASLISISIVIIVALAVALLMFLTVLAKHMSNPLAKMAKNSTLVVQNIGGDSRALMKTLAKEGYEVSNGKTKFGEVGEVATLRQRFDGLWVDLAQRRRQAVADPNPLLSQGKILDGTLYPSPDPNSAIRLPLFDHSSPDVPMRLQNLREGESKIDIPASKSVDVERSNFVSPLTPTNRMSHQLMLKLVTPTVLALIVLIGVGGWTLVNNVVEWSDPVRTMLIAEERASLDLRVKERANLVQQFLSRGNSTLAMFKDVAESLVTGDLEQFEDFPLVVQSSSQCDSVKAFAAHNRTLNRGDTVSTKYYNLMFDDSSCTPDFSCTCYQPTSSVLSREELAEGVTRDPRSGLLVDHNFVWHPQSKLSRKITTPGAPAHRFSSNRTAMQFMANLVHAMRPAFFSTDMTEVYFATDDSEHAIFFPYTDKSTSWPERRYCDSVADVADEAWGVDGASPAPSFYRNVQSDGYNPVCRPWYQRARKRGTGTVFNPIDFSATSGQPYLALSTTAVVPGNGSVIGVASIDLEISRLKKTLDETKLYESGYALVWDSNGLTVSHKSMENGLQQYDIAWMDATAGGKFDIDQAFMTGQKEGIWDKGRVNGTWVYDWNNPQTGKVETWYYTFTPIEGTPYMIALSNKDSEVTEVPDKLIQELYGQVITTVFAIVVVIGASVVFMSMAAVSFNGRIANPILELATFVANLKQDHYAKDVPESKTQAASYELRQIFGNVERMVTALRFGNQEYTNGNKEMEMRSYVEALKIIEETGIERGRGVCFNNMGLCARALRRDPTFDSHAPFWTVTLANGEVINPCQDIEGDFRRAVESGRMVLKGLGEGELEVTRLKDSLASRLVNWGLEKIEKGGVENLPSEVEAGALLLEEGAEETNKGSLMGKMIFSAMMDVARSHHLWGGALAPPVVAASMCKVARKALNTRPEDGEEGHPGMAEAVCVICLLEGGPNAAGWACWALSKIHNMPSTVFRGLVYVALQGSPDLHAPMEASLPPADKFVMENATALQYMVRPPQKSVVFIIDRTWGPILQVAIDSVAMVFERHMGPRDMFGLYGLGDGYILPSDIKSKMTVEQINGEARLSGSCRLGQSMSRVLTQMQGHRGYDRWLVVLSDSVDLDPDYINLGTQVANQIKQMSESGLNLAFINSEKISGWEPRSPKWPSFRENLRQFVGACGKNGHLLPADNAQAVGAAFEKIAMLMGQSDMTETL